MLLIITGLSGAGKSTALHALEDLGFFCTDNLPVEMLSGWAEHVEKKHRNAAVCVDIRSSSSPDELNDALEKARGENAWQLLFIDASDEVLLRRFSTLRRKHPFRSDEELAKTIDGERNALKQLREHANLVLNSSNLNPYELSELVESFWKSRCESRHLPHDMVCSIISFSYQRGLPPDADMVVDMRFLPNPHYQPELAPLTGQDGPVQTFLAGLEDVNEAEAKLCDWLSFIWPRLRRERKRYFTLALGCSGGKHRSVYMAERVAKWLRDQNIATPVLSHRELDRTAP
ncbi:MAG: RNase adapter RapZ [Mariprofundaceae bacterium]|nr:RNase adapter RapZ [Mariprofundaceae bacterium]